MIRTYLSRQSPARVARFWAAYWVCLFVIMHTPEPEQLHINVNHLDKFAHFFLYALLASFCIWHRIRRNLPATLRWSATWLALFSAYAAIDELLQPFVHRTASIADWLTDVAAVTLVLIATRHR